ncbi:MAG: hypothetical protein WCL32_02290 [Planctomycetota bacterium]
MRDTFMERHREIMIRFLCLILIAGTPFASGCALMIARCGTDLYALENKQMVRCKLGEPVASGFDIGKPFEDYRTRRIIAEQYPARCFGPGYGMLLIMTCGTSELVSVPYELCILGRRSLLGHTVRVYYEEDGSIRFVQLDEESLFAPRDAPIPVIP